jgi:PAS domain S-box-containing protein
MRLKYVNPATEHLTGYSRQELLEMRFNDLFPEDEKKSMRNWGMQVQRGKTHSSHGEFRVITKSREERWINLTTTTIDFDNKRAAIGTAFDVIEYMLEETRKRLTELELLYQASLAAAQIHSLDEVAERIVNAIENLFKWRDSIWLVEDLKPVLLVYSSIGLTGESLKNEFKRIDNLITSFDAGIIGWVCKSVKTICTGDVRNESHYIINNENVNSELCVPLKVGGKTIGCINVESEITNAFSNHDERLLTTLANQAAIAIENARLFEETHRRAIRQAALNAIITISARTGTDPAEILNATLEQTLKALNLDMGAIWLSWSIRGIQRMASKNVPQAIINTLMANAALTAGNSYTRTQVVDDWRIIKRKISEQFISMGINSTILFRCCRRKNRSEEWRLLLMTHIIGRQKKLLWWKQLEAKLVLQQSVPNYLKRLQSVSMSWKLSIKY